MGNDRQGRLRAGVPQEPVGQSSCVCPVSISHNNLHYNLLTIILFLCLIKLFSITSKITMKILKTVPHKTLLIIKMKGVYST